MEDLQSQVVADDKDNWKGLAMSSTPDPGASRKLMLSHCSFIFGWS